jgi:hypothetical protein
MKTNLRVALTVTAAAAVALVVGISMVPGGLSHDAADADITAASSPRTNSSQPAVVDKGWFSVQETITNNTNTDWTWNSQNTTEGTNNHWQARPQQVLKAHSSEVVSDYTDDGVLGESVQVAYTMPNGDYVVSLFESSQTSYPMFDPTFTGVFTQNPVNSYPPQDKAYSTTDNPGSGYHADATFSVAPTA